MGNRVKAMLYRVIDQERYTDCPEGHVVEAVDKLGHGEDQVLIEEVQDHLADPDVVQSAVVQE